jgi:uncharacterized protein
VKIFLWVAALLCAASVGMAAQAGAPAARVLRGGVEAGAPAARVLRGGVEVDTTTPLHWAVYRDDVAEADKLLRGGAVVDAANREGITPLAMASLQGNIAMIERLLKAGANAKQRGANGETMVMFASRNGNPAAVRMLVAAGADVNAKETLRGTTALMWAAERRNPEAVRALLELGADHRATSGPAGLPRNYFANRVNTSAVTGSQKRRVAAIAAGRTYEEQLEADRKAGLVSAAPVLGTPGSPASAPVRPALPPQPDDSDDADVVVSGLVGTGGGGLTALVFAAREGDLESARALLDAGADVNQQTTYGWTPLLTAVNNRNYRLAAHLIERGANVNLANRGGWTPLYLATDNRNIEGGDYPVPKPDLDHFELLRLLLQKGADPNARVRENTLTRTIFTMQWFWEAGATAFVRAAQSGDTALMKLLLEHGADPKIPTDLGDTALTAAAGIGWVEGVTYERSAKENLEAIRMLLDVGLDPNGANNEGRTALMGAALKGRGDVVQLLVDRGARLDTRDRGSRDTDKIASMAAGHTWQAIDYAEGLVRVGVQGAIARPETAALLRKLMTERGLPVPSPERTINTVCVVALCAGTP